MPRKLFYLKSASDSGSPPSVSLPETDHPIREVSSVADSLTHILYSHPPTPAVSAVRPSSLRRLRSDSPTADHSTSPTKRKTDDSTPLRSPAPPVSSIPHRHQTCRAESSKAAHFPDKSAQSAAINKRCSLRSRADREFTRLPGPYIQAYIQTQHHRRTSRHLSRAPFPQALLIENSSPFRIASRHINRLTHTQPFTADVWHIQRAVSNSLPSPF